MFEKCYQLGASTGAAGGQTITRQGAARDEFGAIRITQLATAIGVRSSIGAGHREYLTPRESVSNPVGNTICVAS